MRRLAALAAATLALVGCNSDTPEKPPKPLFGFNSGLSLWAVQPKTEVRYEQMAGANAQRFVASWRNLQPTPRDPPLAPTDRRAAIDRLYKTLVENHMTPIIVAGSAPPWAARPHNHGSDWLPPGENHITDWQKFVKALTDRYPRAVIEPWNEPNFGVFWSEQPPDPTYMAQLQCAAYRAVPRNRVVLSTGFAVRNGFEHYATAFYRRAQHCFDGLSVHLYGNVDKRIDAVQSVFKDRTPIWVTETGSSSLPGSLTEKQQAKQNRRLYNAAAALPGIKAILFNTLRDGPDPEPLRRPKSREYHYGFLRVDFSPKPTYCDFAKRC
ncbi:MAG TPA: glycosyl hydrolase [Thermoleophilaceae bacterium]|jgi:hypothetical protein